MPCVGGEGGDRGKNAQKNQRASAYLRSKMGGAEAGAGSGRGGFASGLSPFSSMLLPRISPRSRKAQRLGESREGGWWKWRLVLAVSSSLWFSEVGGF